MNFVLTDDGIHLAYRVDGPVDAPVLLFANSLGTGLRMAELPVVALADRFSVVHYDSRGHGHSDAPAGPYTLERLALDAVALLDALDVECANVCGLSLGGMVAL